MLDQIKFSYNNPELRKTIEGSLIADIKTADLVVIDDVGSELGKDASDSRAFGINTLNSFLDARQNLATIITTNLLGKELKKLTARGRHQECLSILMDLRWSFLKQQISD